MNFDDDWFIRMVSYLVKMLYLWNAIDLPKIIQGRNVLGDENWAEIAISQLFFWGGGEISYFKEKCFIRSFRISI